MLGHGMEAGDRRSVRLNDYTEYVPMRVSGHNIVDAGGGEAADYIRIRLSRTVRLMVELDEYWDVSIYPASPDDDMEAGSSLVYTDDWLYFLLNVRGGDGELFDASEMPGGVWSVWRVPCSQRTADDGGTFWLCDFAAMESFYELGEDWQDAYLMLSEDGQRLGCGEEGEICVRGMTLMLGYYNDEEATREAIDADGFLHTGDLGYFDADGTLYISGRKKDIIIRSGNNISTVGVEKKIMSLPSVYTASVVGIRDAKSTEAPAAMVVLKTGCARTEGELLHEMESVLTRLEMPVRVMVVPALPLTSSGKPDKQKIKAMLSEG